MYQGNADIPLRDSFYMTSDNRHNKQIPDSTDKQLKPYPLNHQISGVDESEISSDTNRSKEMRIESIRKYPLMLKKSREISFKKRYEREIFKPPATRLSGQIGMNLLI